MKTLELYEIEQKIAELCRAYANKKISRFIFDVTHKSLSIKRDRIAAKK